jgi:hypothetical protein
MYVTIETDDRYVVELDRSKSYLELLNIDEACIWLRATVEEVNKEPNPSIVIVVEQLVNVDNAVYSDAQTTSNYQWLECTSVNKPLFVLNALPQNVNGSVYFDNATGRSYLRIDLKNQITGLDSKINLQECVCIQLSPPTFGEDVSCPIFRFSFYQYQNTKRITHPIDWIPPFVFGVFSQRDNFKNLVAGYNQILKRIPSVEVMLDNPEMGGFHIQEHIRAALNRLEGTNYKTIPLPEVLPSRQFALPLVPIIPKPEAFEAPSPLRIRIPAPQHAAHLAEPLSTSPPPSKRMKLDTEESGTPTSAKPSRTSKFVLDDIMSRSAEECKLEQSPRSSFHFVIPHERLSEHPIAQNSNHRKREQNQIEEDYENDKQEDYDEEQQEEEGYEEDDTIPEEQQDNDTDYSETKPKSRRNISTRASRGRSSQKYQCTVCEQTKEDQIGDIKRQVTRSNVYLYELVFNKKISCGRVCADCLTQYNAAPCTLCGGTDFKSGTLSLKADLIPKYEAAFGKRDIKEGKLCRGCYGKFYAYQSKSLNKKPPVTSPTSKSAKGVTGYM